MWGPHVLRLFTDSYSVVDAVVKKKMEDMANTWRHGGPGLTPLFGPGVQMEIDQFLAANGPPSGFAASTAHAFRKPLSIRIEDQIRSAQAQLSAAPDDSDLSMRVTALTGLKKVVESGTVSPSDQAKIEAQIAILEKVNPTAAAAGPAVIATPSPPARSASAQLTPVVPPPAVATPPSATVSALATAATTGPTAPAPAPTTNDLFAKILQSGLLNKLPGQTPTPPASHAPVAPATAAALPGAPLDLAGGPPDQDDRYTREILAMSIPWNSHELLNPSWPDVTQICQEELPLPCKQCGRRFPGGMEGQESMRKHLDWHFRQNKAVKDSIARGQSRIWFPRMEEFVTGGADDNAFALQHGLGEAEAQRLTAEKEAELRQLFVPAPSDPDVAASPCVICKEPFKSGYNEDEEEWVWYNTVKKNELYMHATCEFSQRSLTSNVAARQQATATPDRRDGTPDVSRLRLQNQNIQNGPTSTTTLTDAVEITKPEAGSGLGASARKRSRSELEADDATAAAAAAAATQGDNSNHNNSNDSSNNNSDNNNDHIISAPIASSSTPPATATESASTTPALAPSSGPKQESNDDGDKDDNGNDGDDAPYDPLADVDGNDDDGDQDYDPLADMAASAAAPPPAVPAQQIKSDPDEPSAKRQAAA